MKKHSQKLPFFGLINSKQTALSENPDSVDDAHVTQLMMAATDYFQKVVLIDPTSTVIELHRENKRPSITYRNQDISALTVLMVRSTFGVESPTRVLANTLKELGCIMVDPVSRFAGSRASKTMSTLRRHQEELGSDSFICFNNTGAMELANSLQRQKVFPVITKPVHGYKGIGVKALESVESYLEYSREHFASKVGEPLLVQKLMDFKHEYRVLMIHRKCIGVVEKIRNPESIVANAAQGSEFKPADVPEVVEFVRNNCAKSGFMGVDAAVDAAGEIHIIEENRAPNWNHIQQSLNIDVAAIIMARVYKSAKSHLRKNLASQ